MKSISGLRYMYSEIKKKSPKKKKEIKTATIPIQGRKVLEKKKKTII